MCVSFLSFFKKIGTQTNYRRIIMHMADALVSPAVGGAMLAVSAGLVAYSARKMRKDFDPSRIPLMGIMGAFVFAAQMINFAIPGTGSSGHIGGAVLLAALLGPYAAFLALTCVLVIQALFFADGGLLALGCNIFNMGFFGCFLAYPIFLKPMAGNFSNPVKVLLASILACIVSLQLGAFCVVLETLVSGVTQLPFGAFVALMQPIHLSIGVVEGALTGLAIVFVYRARPQIFLECNAQKSFSYRAVLGSLLIAALAIGGGLSLLASGDPNGLEWSMEKVAGTAELESSGAVHGAAADVQEKTSFLPDYSIPDSESAAGTSVAGIVGSLITLAAALAVGFALKPRTKRTRVCV